LFFQYALAFGLFITVTVGLSGLLGRVIDSTNIVIADQSSLASNLAFIVVGGPLLAGMTLWLRKSIVLNPSDGTGFVPTFFATLLSVISLLVFLTSAISALQGALDSKPILGASFARAIVWGIALVVILRVADSVIPKNDFRIQYFVGSLITAIAALVGLIKITSNLFAAILSQSNLLGDQQSEIVKTGNNALDGFVILVISGALWFYYWVKKANTKTNDTLWLSYVLVAGVGGSLVLAVTSVTVTIYQILVWMIGNPASQLLSEHFASTPASAASAIAGLLAWWYHMVRCRNGTSHPDDVRGHDGRCPLRAYELRRECGL
jgi:hypothetical protein